MWGCGSVSEGFEVLKEIFLTVKVKLFEISPTISKDWVIIFIFWGFLVEVGGIF